MVGGGEAKLVFKEIQFGRAWGAATPHIYNTNVIHFMPMGVILENSLWTPSPYARGRDPRKGQAGGSGPEARPHDQFNPLHVLLVECMYKIYREGGGRIGILLDIPGFV